MIVISQLYWSHSPPPNIRGGLVFEVWTKWGVMENCSEIRGQLKGGGGFSQKGGFSNLFHHFSLRKACFHYYWNFCQVNIYTCCNQQIYSFMWFTFYQKMIYMKFLFLLLLFFNFVKMLLLLTFTSIFISLKTSDFLENKSRVFERSDSTITVHGYLYCNELKI